MIDLTLPGDALTASLVDVPSVSGGESRLADEVERALRQLPHLSVERDGDAVAARTDLGRAHRIVVAGHLDTVPIADNLPSRRDGDRLFGCGTSDMKAGIAVMLRVAAGLEQPQHDVTWLFYDNEEVEAARNGLGRVARNAPHWLTADLAVLMEPTANRVEAGCQGTLRALVVVPGKRAHSARSWLGDNAIHRAADVLTRLAAYEARRVVIDGCEYREGLNAVRIEGGVSGNVVPDRCTVTVNYRFAPDRDEEQALAHVQEVLAPFEVVPTDSSPGALPRLSEPAAAEFVAAVGGEPVAKLGWTDVARFAALGIPAVNFGPGDPNLAHTREEYVEIPRIGECERVLRAYLAG
ncbi:MAG: succinyl-diaminopimelate desuccinylase [Frankiaceae bacterium]|nr:succinyl-diaminopimelate desuccinylase [Frankiaceae bacterium]MBV9369318.1 succinyl-diaminopimelate desuccinylase [Frankiales bacterium]